MVLADDVDVQDLGVETMLDGGAFSILISIRRAGNMVGIGWAACVVVFKAGENAVSSIIDGLNG